MGDSLFAMMGDFEGGALELEDGRRFSEKYKWYRYNGAVTAHGVAPFSGERITCVLYTEPPRTEAYELRSDGFRSLNTEAHEAAAEHPRVKIQEDPAAEAERERVLNIQKEKAALEWRQTAANKLWNLVRAGLEVYRHSGEKLTADPRATESIKVRSSQASA